MINIIIYVNLTEKCQDVIEIPDVAIKCEMLKKLCLTMDMSIWNHRESLEMENVDESKVGADITAYS